METFLTRLERRFGRFAFGNVTFGLVILQVLGFGVCSLRPELAYELPLDGARVMAGEWWRLVSWLAAPMSMSPIWFLFGTYFLYFMGHALEEAWGSFRYELYWIVGLLTTMAVAVGFRTQADIDMLVRSLFLAFATMWPRHQLYVLFIIPVQVRWLAIIAGATILFSIGSAPGFAKFIPLAAVTNYLLFFSETLYDRLRGRFREEGRSRARARFNQANRDDRPKARTCAICGVSNDDPNVDMRVCNCEKCGGVLRDLCLEHARNH